MALAGPLGFQAYPASTGSPFDSDDTSGGPEILEASTTQFHVRPDAPPLKVSLPADRQAELSRNGVCFSKREETGISNAGFGKLDVDHSSDQSPRNISLQSAESKGNRAQNAKLHRENWYQSRHNSNVCQVSIAVELEKPPMNLASPAYQRNVQHAPSAATPYVQLGLRPGAAVALYNLQEAADASLNGSVGVLEFWNQKINRWSVRFSNGEQKFVQPVNLLELTGHPSGNHRECSGVGVTGHKIVEEGEQILCKTRRDASATVGSGMSSRRNSKVSTGSRRISDSSTTLTPRIPSRRSSGESVTSIDDKAVKGPHRRISEVSTTSASTCSSRSNSMESTGSLGSQTFDLSGAAFYILSTCRNYAEFERAVDGGVFDMMKIETKSRNVYDCEKTPATLGSVGVASRIREERCPPYPVQAPNVSPEFDGSSEFVPSNGQGAVGHQRPRYPRIRNRTMYRSA